VISVLESVVAVRLPGVPGATRGSGVVTNAGLEAAGAEVPFLFVASTSVSVQGGEGETGATADPVRVAA
jgi:hypothetical protein